MQQSAATFFVHVEDSASAKPPASPPNITLVEAGALPPRLLKTAFFGVEHQPGSVKEHMRRIVSSWPLLMALSAAVPASAATFVARTSASGFPGPSSEARDFSVGHGPVRAQSEHTGSEYYPYDPFPQNPPYGTEVTVQSRATARSDMAGIHLLASGAGLLQNAQPYYHIDFAGHAKASASIGDSFTVRTASTDGPTTNAPSTSGTPSVLVGKAGLVVHALLGGTVDVAGSTDPALPGNAEVYLSWTARMVVSDASGILGDLPLSGGCTYSANTRHGLPACGGDGSGVYLMSVSFIAGQSLSVSIEGEVRTSVFGTQTRGGMAVANGLSDFDNTIAWGGFHDVRDVHGNPVAGFSALSDSTGFDYAAAFPSAVPEPSTGMLLLSGLAGLARLGQRRRRSAPLGAGI